MRLSFAGRFLLGIGFLLAAPGCVPEDPAHEFDDVQIHRQPIKGGTTDYTSTSVVGIVAADGYAGGICTGSLIAPNLVLTAQHCVAEVTSQYVQCGTTAFGATKSISGIMVTTDTVMSYGSDFRPSTKVHVPDGANDMCGYDIALIELRDNLPANIATPLVPRIDIAPQAGEVYRAVGYGVDGTNQQSAGTRRVLDNRAVQCNGGSCPSYSTVQTSEFLGNDGTCQGDSGGPAIDMQGRVLGALSRGPSGCTASIYSGVTEWSDWIRGITKEAAERGGYEVPFWAEFGVSEIPDDDQDVDGVLDDVDNCPGITNPEQDDADDDGIGDLCDTDSDNDGVEDDEDNCADTANEDQGDIDGDGVGDACDDDMDGDGWENQADACPEDPTWFEYDSPCGTDVDDLEVTFADEEAGCSTAANAGPGEALGSFGLVALLLGLFGWSRRRRA